MKRILLFLAVVFAVSVSLPLRQAQAAIQPRIVGGTVAGLAEFPYQVLVLFDGYMCGGSIISNQYILTAAHCSVDDYGDTYAPSFYTVYAGLQNAGSLAKNGLNPYFEMRRVSAVLTNFNYDAGTMDYDVALLKLSTPLVWNAGVKPVKLATTDRNTQFNNALYRAGATSTVSGWGTTSSGGDVSNKLRKVSLPLYNQNLCKSDYAGQITPRMVCAGLVDGGKDSCQGDSGGPLVVKVGGVAYQVGVVSWGDACAAPNAPGVYTKVSYVFNWIKNNAHLTSW